MAVVGAGITGLFAAYYLEREGAEVTVFDERAPGDRSVHAAGILEATQAYRTNTFAFLRRVFRLWRHRTCAFRSVDGRWLLESARRLDRPPEPGSERRLLELGSASLAAYAALARARDDFGFSVRGLTEVYEDPVHFRHERAVALARRAAAPVEVREDPGGGGTMFFPEVGWLHTERFVARMLRELGSVRFVRARAAHLALDGTVTGAPGPERFDAIVACTGVSSRSLGVPLTGVKGYGWHLRVRAPVPVATIHVDRGVALVPLDDGLKATGGWDFDLSSSVARASTVLAQVRGLTEVLEVLDFNHGIRPTTPDGLPTVGRKGNVVVANGGFRLGWSFAPGMGQEAARLALGRGENDPFLARFCGRLRSGALR